MTAATTGHRFAPVSRRSLADDVRDQLAANIRSGALPPGAVIPVEEALCAELGVSRGSVREAIREIITIGLAERRGNRVYVVEYLPDVRIESIERLERIREVFETRSLIEVQLTALAAQRATSSQRDEIVALAERMRRVSSVEELRPLDRAFHRAIAAAAGNAMLAELHAKVLDAIFSSSQIDAILRDERDSTDMREILDLSYGAHIAIAAAVSSGDAAAATEAARTHLIDVERRVTASSTARRSAS